MGVYDSNKDWTKYKWWCQALKEKGSSNLEDCNVTQNQQLPPQKIKNNIKDSGVVGNRATSIFLLPTESNDNKIPLTRPIPVGTAGGSTLTK